MGQRQEVPGKAQGMWRGVLGSRGETREEGGGVALSTESKRCEVLQLLKEYRAWHTPFGGAMPLDESGVVYASYGPAGYIYAGMAHPKRDRGRLAKSYRDLEHAITIEKRTEEGFLTWVLLLEAYFGSEADPGVVSKWRNAGDHRIDRHDTFVENLAHHLRKTDLYVVWPKRMSSQEEKQIERRNDELYFVYKTLRSEGRGKSKAVKEAATRCGYSERRAWDIVKAREPSSASKAC